MSIPKRSNASSAETTASLELVRGHVYDDMNGLIVEKYDDALVEKPSGWSVRTYSQSVPLYSLPGKYMSMSLLGKHASDLRYRAP